MDDAARDDGAAGRPAFFCLSGVGYEYCWSELPGHWATLLKALTIDALKSVRLRRAAAAEYARRKEAGPPA